MQLGIIYYTQNNFSKSLEYYNSSVSEYEKIGDKSRIATLFYLSGINYSKLKNFGTNELFDPGKTHYVLIKKIPQI